MSAPYYHTDEELNEFMQDVKESKEAQSVEMGDDATIHMYCDPVIGLVQEYLDTRKALRRALQAWKRENDLGEEDVETYRAALAVLPEKKP